MRGNGVTKIAIHIITYRWYWLAGIVLSTLFFGYHASQMKMVTVFDDLFPQQHKYIKVHNSFRELFGGANLVSLELRVKEGNIFNTKTLYACRTHVLQIKIKIHYLSANW